jgi:hypothetical protein
MKFALKARIALASLLICVAGTSEAALSTTVVFPTLSVLDTFAAQPFDAIDPSAYAIDVHVTGLWTFEFAHESGAAPYTGDIYYWPSLTIFFAGPHGNDGVGGLETGPGRAASFVDFTGTQTFEIAVDATTFFPHGQTQNLTGPGRGNLDIEGLLGQSMQLSDSDPGAIYLSGGTVRDLTFTLTAVPEPNGAFLLLAGLVAIVNARRTRRT